MISCPECNGSDYVLAGNRYVGSKRIQRYLCRICGYRFSEKNVLSKTCQTGSCQICVSLTEGMENLSRTEQNTALRKNEKGDLVSFAWHLKKLGRNKKTIKTYTKNIGNIGKYCDIYDPEAVKSIIASHFKDNNTKRLACCAYNAFTKFNGISWLKPQYKPEHKRAFIPTEEELQIAINTGQRESVIYSKFLYETGARDNEVQRLEWTDIDTERKRVTLKASKHGNSRIVPISQNLIELLFSLSKKHNTVFPKRSQNSRTCAFHARMIRLSKVYNNKRFIKIHLHTFRHCKALREYHKTKSILHVKRVLGHKSINTTMRYVDWYEELYDDLQPTDYTCETAMNAKEAKKLIESGFEYVCEIDGLKMFRKVKV